MELEFLIGIVLSILAFWFFAQKKGIRLASANGAIADWLQSFVAEESAKPAARPTPTQRGDGSSRPSLADASTAETPYQNLPQDSVLRRHYLTHVRYMIEAVAITPPTDSALLRHYKQLIESQLDDCLKSEAHMQKLVSQFEAYKKAA